MLELQFDPVGPSVTERGMLKLHPSQIPLQQQRGDSGAPGRTSCWIGRLTLGRKRSMKEAEALAVRWDLGNTS